MSSVRWRNLGPLLQLVGWLVLWAIVLNAGLDAASQTPLLSWLPDRQTGLGFAEDNRQRIEGAEKEYRAGAVRADKRLGAIVGISNTREAVDLDKLNQDLGASWRFIGVAGAGASAASIVENARLLQDSNLRPDLVIIGVTPLLMLDSLTSGNFQPVAPSLYDRVKALVKPVIWLSARRPDVSVSTERALLAIRAKLFSLFDVRLPTSDTASPWRSMLRLMGAEHYTKKVLEVGVQNARAAGDFDIRSFEHARQAPTMLGQTIAGFASRGAFVIVVLTPEHSMLRSHEPPGVAQLIADQLRTASGLPSLQVLDLRGAVPDTGLVDLVHMNSSGSNKFTKLLAREIKTEHLATAAPLMASMDQRISSQTPRAHAFPRKTSGARERKRAEAE